MEKLGFPHYPDEWRFLTDASKLRLKDVLHDGTVKPLIPAAHSVATRENHMKVCKSKCYQLQEALLEDMW